VSNQFPVQVKKLRKRLRTFHILDSYTNDSQSRRELRQLQRILLTLSPGVFDEGRIALNHAQVGTIARDNHSFQQLIQLLRYPSKPMARTVGASPSILPKDFSQTLWPPWPLSRYAHQVLYLISTHLPCQTPFASGADALVGWGLKDSNMTFVRHQIRTLLFQYIDRGDAIVEFEE